jgi:pimeloyl-[acyl-carrier protein] methyl ester esterase
MTNAATLPALVLLPGLDGTGKLFSEFVKDLGSSVDSLIVGYPRDEPLGYDELEALVLAALPRDQPFILLGESFSGPIAIRIAARSPAGLVAVILCGTFAKNPFPWLRWARPLAAYLPLKSLPRWVRAPLMWGSASPQRAPAQMERAIAGVSPAVIRHRIAALLAVDESAALGAIRLPTLVLRARRDRVISRAATRWILKILPGARLVEIDGPHLLLQTRPAECAAIVLEFMGYYSALRASPLTGPPLRAFNSARRPS